MTSGLVSIGLPVYNGADDLRRSLDSLLSQTHTNFELIISDNASTDAVTQRITEEYAARDPRIRLTRQQNNRGAITNFLWVLNQSRGEFFMWAAHDDAWADDYIDKLVNSLVAAPDAVLATPTTLVEMTMRTGAKQLQTIPAAPNAGCQATLDVFIEHIACTWIYGMYRSEWLKTAAPEMLKYPLLYGDIIWMYGLLLERQVVGNADARFHYTAVQGKRRELTPSLKMKLWAIVLYQTIRLTWSRVPRAKRLLGLRKACWFYYRHHVRRGNPVGTTVRIIKLLVMWSWFGLKQMASAIWARLQSTTKSLSHERIQTTHAVQTNSPSLMKCEERHAA